MGHIRGPCRLCGLEPLAGSNKIRGPTDVRVVIRLLLLPLGFNRLLVLEGGPVVGDEAAHTKGRPGGDAPHRLVVLGRARRVKRRPRRLLGLLLSRVGLLCGLNLRRRGYGGRQQGLR